MNLRQAAQQALEAWFRPHGINYVDFKPYMEALRAALAEPECKCTMTQKMVGDGCAVCNPERAKDLSEPEQNPFGEDAERYARKLHEEREAYKALFTERKPQTTHWEGCEAVHPECRKPEQEPDGISWLKRDSGYFTAPTPRKPLTDEEIDELSRTMIKGDRSVNWLCRAIERAHGIGEQHGS